MSLAEGGSTPSRARRRRSGAGPLYLRLTALLLVVLLLFGSTVVGLHTVALARATVPLRLQMMRLMAERALQQPSLVEGDAAEQMAVTVLDARSGQLLAGTSPPPWIPDPLALPRGEACGFLGGPCHAVREGTTGGRAVRVIVHYLPKGRSFFAPLGLGFLASVLLWLLVSAAGGLLLLRALERADAARQRLLAGLAHDLGTPLTSIRGFAETLLQGSAQGAERRGWTVVYREALRMQRLVEDMLALTRIEAGALALVRRPLDLRDVLRAAAERAALAHGQAPELLVPDTPCLVEGDRDRLDQALANLVDNAYRHGQGQLVRLSLEADPSAWRVGVRDSGPGFAWPSGPAERGRRFDAGHALFEAFERGDAQAGGSGLGLHVVREIVLRHGGTLVASNPPEGGGLVALHLPRLQEGFVDTPLGRS